MTTPTVITLPLSTFENMNMEQMWRINDCLHQARQAGKFLEDYKTYCTWLQMTSQRLPFTSSYKTPIKTFEQIINEMSTSSESCTSSPDEYPFITATELSHLLLDHGMNFAVSNAFSASPLSTALLQNYLFLSQNIEHL